MTDRVHSAPRLRAIDRAIEGAPVDAIRSIAEHWDLDAVDGPALKNAVRVWARDSITDGQPLAMVCGIIREGV